MTIKDKFLAKSDVYNLPCMVILEEPVEMYSFKNILYFISQEKHKDIYEKKYISACVQKDLEGNDSFLIIFGKSV